MKVRDTLKIDLIYTSRYDKLMNFLHGQYRYTDTDAKLWIKNNFLRWQYNGSAPFEEIMLWCEEQFHNDWFWDFETIYFKHESDRLLFLLKWAR